MADGNRFFPAPRLILTALVAGVLAGAVAVYVSESGSGNNAPAQIAVGDSKDDVACAAKSERAKKVAAAATGQVAALLPADPPQSLKSLAFNGPDGNPMTIADHAGKTVLLNLWATWCAPCRKEMPSLAALQSEMGSRDFEVVAISVDRKGLAASRQFLNEVGASALKLYADPSAQALGALQAVGLPASILIDRQGREIGRLLGPAEWNSPEAKALIKAAVDEK
jgi:thiol-disulfide isomerase/thioredoxin